MLKRAISVVALMIALPTDAQELPAGYSAVGAESETLLPVGLPEEGDHKKIAEALAEAEDSGEQALQLIRAVLEAAAVEHLPEGTKVRVEEALTRYLLPLPVGQEAENVVGYSALSKLRPQNTDYSRKRDVFASRLEDRRRTVLDRYTTAVDAFTKTTFYTHRSQPFHDSRPYVSMYISKDKDGGLDLRFVLNYASSYGWLYVRGAEANIDGDIVTIPATSWKRGNNTKIWEWSDERASAEDLAIAKRIVNSRQTVVRFNGPDFSDNYIVDGADKEVLRDAFVAYQALGGQLPSCGFWCQPTEAASKQ